MADDEQFSLCWNNFNTNLSAGFHESLCRGDLVDVSLAAEGQIVKAHRLVLSVCSPFFRKMFTSMPSNTHAIVFLNNVSHSALKDLIQFMYCGEVNVKQDALPAFISTAESLQIKGLTDNDPAPQAPQPEPTPPPPAAPQHVQQVVATQRVQRQQQPRASARYKIETVDDVLGDEKGTTQIVIQTTAAPQATIVQQQPPQQHIQQTQQLQPAATTTTTATLVSTSKRSAQRSSLSGSGAVKRSKTSVAPTVIDPLETNTETANTTTTAQLVPQQITVQTTVVAAASDAKLQQQTARQQSQQAAAQAQAETAEYIDLPIEIPTKSEPDYSEEHGEVADGETTYVEDDTYGDMRYDDSYFTENEDASGPQTGAGASGTVTATTSKAVIKQQVLPSYSEAPFGDTSGGEQGNTEAQAISVLPRKRGRPKTKVEDTTPKLKLLDKLKAATKNEAASAPAVYASTTKGGVKLVYDGHHFRFSFRKAEYSVFQCCYKENREECRVRVVCDQKNVFPFDGEHVHFVQASDKSVTSSQFTPGGGIVGATEMHIKEVKVDEEDDDQNKQYVEIDEADIEEQVVELLEKPITTDDIADTSAEAETKEEDPQDFREKIKRRLQRALQNKKK